MLRIEFDLCRTDLILDLIRYSYSYSSRTSTLYWPISNFKLLKLDLLAGDDCHCLESSVNACLINSKSSGFASNAVLHSGLSLVRWSSTRLDTW